MTGAGRGFSKGLFRKGWAQGKEPRNGKIPEICNIWRGKDIKLLAVREGCLDQTAFNREWSQLSTGMGRNTLPSRHPPVPLSWTHTKAEGKGSGWGSLWGHLPRQSRAGKGTEEATETISHR